MCFLFLLVWFFKIDFDMLEFVICKILKNFWKYDILLGIGVFVYVIKLVGLGLDILFVLYNLKVR